ncbi:uncharacterized protein EAE97_003702 [Botrytis byssoidea]|uniref:Uncharacterized protein n=1 Tax=Botrytis byssoidea TaxID=139641 RepID=A0A9P5IT01_9HELO|nr:uncharacterized protein EAE97_003702 [Botrytis byssoidea]KAF7948291.1 hypothetical protein EAE97_003702 [Botrytis byssoidea]
MDRGLPETDLGMDLIEQWDWQRFREAESMELEDEEDSAMQTQTSIENGAKVKETTKDVGRMVEAGEVDPRGSQNLLLPQCDGPADDEDVIEENGSVSKIGIEDMDVESRQAILLQCDGQAVSISKIGGGDVDVSSRRDDTAASDIPTEEGLDKNAPVAQKQKMVMEDVKSYKEESGAISEKYNDTADGQEDQEMNLAGDKSIPDFPEEEIGDQELVKVDEPALLEETRKNTLKTITTTTEMTIDSSLIADADPFGGKIYFEKQIHDKSDDKIKDSGLDSENPVSERGNDISNSEKAVTEIGAGLVIDKFIDEETNQIGKICDHVPTSNTTYSETIVETERIVNKDANSGNEDHGAESITSGFLSNEDLRDLEGKPSSISILEQSPVEFAPGDDFLEGAPSIDENITNSTNTGNVSNPSHIQDLRITNQLPVDDDSLNDVELPSLSRLEAPVQPSQVEIPDSDAITESSQQSPQKLSHNRNTFDSSVKYGKNVEMATGVDAVGEENEDLEAEDAMSSFGRECATSSIDPKKNLKELETMESETSQNGIDDFEEIREPAERALIGSAGKVEEDSRADEDNTDIQLSTTQISPQKPTNKRGRPPGIRRSKMANSQADEENIESKAMLVEVGPDKSMGMEDEEDSSVRSPVAERKKRGRPSTRKISTLSVDEHIDKLDDAMEHIAPTDATADDSSPNSPVPEKRNPGRSSSRKVSLLSADELAMEEDKAAVDPPKRHETTLTNKSAEAHSSPRKLPADKVYPSSLTPEKRKRGRPSGRKNSTLSTVTNDDEDLEREKVLMDGNTINSNVCCKSRDEPTGNNPIHSMQEMKRKWRSAGRNPSNLILEENYSEGPDGELDELDGVTAIAPVEIIENHDESRINDSMDEITANSSSPVKRKRGRPAGRKSSGLSPEKTNTEEVARHDSSNVSVIIPGDIEMEQATPSHKSTGKYIAIPSSSVKGKRGRPAGRKSSGVEAENTEPDELSYEASPLPHNHVDVQVTPSEEASDDSDESSSVRPNKKGRPGRKTSELNPEKTHVNEAVNESSGIVTTEETSESIAKESIGDVHFIDELADLDSSPVKRKRGRPASRKVSRLSPEKITVDDAPNIPKKAITDASVGEPVSETQSLDEPQDSANTLPEKKKRGRPVSRKVSAVTDPNKGPIKPPEASQMVIALQETVAARSDQPVVISSSPEKRKRGRPSSHNSSSVITANKGIIGTAEASSSNAATKASDKVVDPDINESAPDPSLLANASPEKRKRGRPARKDSSLNLRNGTVKGISNDVSSGGKNVPTEIVDSDEEEDALLNESPPSKKVRPEPRMRGRPPGTKDLGASTEDTKSGEEDSTGVLSSRAKSGGTNQVVTQIEEKPPASEKKKRGRPSAAKPRRISNSDSDVADEEQQITDKFELRSIESEDLDEEAEEANEQEEPVVEKKKRGRPSLLKNKGKQTAKASEPVDQDVTINEKISTAGGTKNKVSGSQVSTLSNTPSSQRQDAFLAEIKALKLTSIQTRNANLKAEIAQKQEKIQQITEGLEKPAKQTVKRHIRLLHDYNDIKDVGQGLLGMIADNRGVRVGEMYEEFGLGIAD